MSRKAAKCAPDTPHKQPAQRAFPMWAKQLLEDVAQRNKNQPGTDQRD
jgi:hypothetical protein